MLSDVLQMFSDALICFQMFSNVFRIFSIANSRSLDFFRCVQDVFRCSQMFKDVFRCFRCSEMFLDVLSMFSRCFQAPLLSVVGRVGLMGLESLVVLFGPVGLVGLLVWWVL